MSNEYINTQKPAIELLKDLGWKVIEDEREDFKKVLQKGLLKRKLNEINSYYHQGREIKFTNANIQDAIRSLDEDLNAGLLLANQSIFNYLTGSRSYPGEDGRGKTFRYIDFDDITNNDFNLIYEYEVTGKDHKVFVDIVLLINGIPVVAIECKDPSVEVEEAVTQNIRNQRKEYAPELYKYIQLTVATNKNEFKYGTCGTPKRFYSLWREEKTEWLEEKLSQYVSDRIPTKQDKNLISILSIERFIDIFRNFIIFDNNEKKTARYQQYFAVKEMLKRIKERNPDGSRKGGVIWHTQGSGKSLTMVMLTKALVGEEGVINAKIVIVTDRINLDAQITETFSNTDLRPHSAGTGADLVKSIKDNKEIITTTLHKFEKAKREGLKDEGHDIFILVDESHRTQYNLLHGYMRAVFPNAVYIGFTGTPLMKSEKNTMHKFGGLIHKYTIQDGVRDKTIVPLIYEGKMVEQSINDAGIDRRLEQITKTLNDREKQDLKSKWSRYKKLASSKTRMSFIAYDINEHFQNQFKETGFKAMLATNSKIEAITYLKEFNKLEDLKSAVLVSPPDTREGYDSIEDESKDAVIKHWEKMIKKYNSKDNYETTLKNEFKHGELDLIIVVDKLLTGFDAPKAVVLYIDKELKEHSLLQAIARVNRVYEGKDYGYIIDYRGLLQQLDEAMDMYSGAGLDKFDPEDIKGALIDIKKVAKDLLNSYSNLKDLFGVIENKKDMEEYEQYLENEEIRDEFYEKLSIFSRALKIVLGSIEATDEVGEEKIVRYKAEFKFFQNIRASVKLRYSDSIDFKEYQGEMKNLIDTYVNANDLIEIVEPVNVMEVERFQKELDKLPTKKAKADMIRTRIGKSLRDIKLSDPLRYKKFSELLKESYEKYKKKRLKESEQLKIEHIDKEYLDEMNDIKEEYQKGKEVKNYPESIRENRDVQVIYDLMDEFKKEVESDNYKVSESNDSNYNIEKTSKEIDSIIKSKIKPEWGKNQDNVNEVVIALIYEIKTMLKENDIDMEFEKIKKIALDIISVAKERYKFE